MAAVTLLLLGGVAALPTPAKLTSPLPDRLGVTIDQPVSKEPSTGTLELLIDPKGQVAGCSVFDLIPTPGSRAEQMALPCITFSLFAKFAPAHGSDGKATWGLWRWSYRLDGTGRLSDGPPIDLAQIQLSRLPDGTRDPHLTVILEVRIDGTVASCQVSTEDANSPLAPYACLGLLSDGPHYRMSRPTPNKAAVATVRAMTVVFSAP